MSTGSYKNNGFLTYSEAKKSDKDSKKPIKKRKYSRGGCEECKRRKMKCDEGKPFCFNCTRLKKTCVYKNKLGISLDASSPNLQKPQEVPKIVNNIEKVDFSPRHYVPNGGYLNSFVTEPTRANQEYDFSFKHEPKEPSIASPPRFTNAISDILTPVENELLVEDNMKSLFDEAILLVNDMNELQSFDVLNYNNIEHLDDKNSRKGLLSQFDLKMTDLKPDLKHEPTDTNEQLKSVPSHTESEGITSVSDTFEKHIFQINDFSQDIINNQNNGHYLREYDLNSPQVINVNHLQDNSIKNSDLIEQTIRQHNLASPHAAYLRFLNKKISSYSLFPFASSVESNEVVNLLLKYSNNCPYLLSALLAMMATVEFNMTGKPVHEMSGQKYVSVCLKSLSQAFANSAPNKVNQFLNDIERLLLTVILLTSIFSSKTYKNNDNILNSWKTHLRGAKDLLVNYNIMTRNQHRHGISGGIALARSWFFAIEALASVTTQMGGTLNGLKAHEKLRARSRSVDSEEESTDHNSNKIVFVDTGYFAKEYNIDYHNALSNIGMLSTSVYHGKVVEFNIFLGFTIEYVLLIEEYSRALEYLRQADENTYQVPSFQILKLMALIQRSLEAYIVPLVNPKDLSIPETSPAHPLFPKIDPNRIELPESAFSRIEHETGPQYHSWFDLSQQVHTDAIYLRILITKGFLNIPGSSNLVNQVIRKILSALFFILPKQSTMYKPDKVLCETSNFFISSDLFDSRGFMIQSPFRLVGYLIDDEESFEKLELLFMGLIKVGNGSSVEALANLRNRRERVRAGDQLDYTEFLQTETVAFS